MVNHLAIIMDGNGRWAEARGLARSDGHRAGVEQIFTVTKAASKAGIKYLTLYAFSTENWKRPLPEVTTLMGLINEFSVKRLPDLMQNGVRLRTIGRTGDLPILSRRSLQKAIEATKDNTTITLNVALSYGGRAEIVDAVNRILKERGKSSKIDEKEFAQYLYAPDVPDPDLMIRTGGEMRLSNFMLWELSYAELYVTDRYWPEFGEADLNAALTAFAGRSRRFGDVKKK